MEKEKERAGQACLVGFSGLRAHHGSNAAPPKTQLRRNVIVGKRSGEGWRRGEYGL